MRAERQEERSQDKADKTGTESQIVVMNSVSGPEANMKKSQCKDSPIFKLSATSGKKGKKPIREHSSSQLKLRVRPKREAKDGDEED